MTRNNENFPSFKEFAEPFSVYSVGAASFAHTGWESFSFELSRRLWFVKLFEIMENFSFVRRVRVGTTRIVTPCLTDPYFYYLC
jgi:hypothetical protein